MSLFGSCLKAGIPAAAVSLGLVVSSANAGVAPDLEFQWFVDGADQSFNPNGNPLGGGTYNYQDSLVDLDYSLSWDINVNPDPFVSGNIVITNTSAFTQEFDLTIVLGSNDTGPGTFLTGSFAGGLTADDGGGTLASLAGAPVWSALVDGAPAVTFLDDPFSVNADPFQSVNVGSGNFAGLAGPALNDSIAIRIAFSLTSGEQASFTSNFFVEIPAPAGLAMIAVGGFFGRRRRRD